MAGITLMPIEPIRRRLAGATLLLFFGALIMSNLIALAQAMKRA